MSFNRTRYDDCATDAYTARSINEGNYRLFPGFMENKEQCFSYNGPRGNKSDVSTSEKVPLFDWSKMAQVESQLQSRTIFLSRCNENQADMAYGNNQTVNKLNCAAPLNAEDTRFTNPVQSYRSLSTMILQLQPFLFSNPQCHVIDDRIGLDSRNKAKDSYTIPKVVMVDKGEALPKENPNMELGYNQHRNKTQCPK